MYESPILITERLTKSEYIGITFVLEFVVIRSIGIEMGIKYEIKYN